MSLSLKWLQNLLPSFNDLTDETSTLTLKQTQCDHKMEQKPETVFPYLGTFKSFIVHLYKNGLKFWLIVQKSPSLVKVEQVFCPSAGPGAINLSAKRRYCHQTIGHCNCTVMTPVRMSQLPPYRYMGRSQDPSLRGLTPPSERVTYA